MPDSFEKIVDKFDSGESSGMNDDEKLVSQIAVASEIVGELELRKTLDQAHRNYNRTHNRKTWLLRIAASIVVILGIGSLIIGNQQNLNKQSMQIDEQPIYGDSALYDLDSLQIISEPDSLKQLNDIK